ncbi:unnamed protein product, partial [Mesorhabditis belari]|uniref:Uncharacterized protein n=1 Tax=Mesorhabditis belari TaxID=2138241 RepID=A0AAF3FDB4_9BILA
MSPASSGSLNRAEGSTSPIDSANRNGSASSANSSSSITPHRSTRGASKQRRDQINVEIGRMRDLLPLSDSIKDRLFQLQVMSLACIFIRKHRYRPHVIPEVMPSDSSDPCTSTSLPSIPTPSLTLSRSLDAGKTLRGFLFMTTKSGKVLYISENASEYLGHSVEEIMCQGDSLYDMVDCRDHMALQNLLGAGPPEKENFPDDKVFLCRMNLSRTAKRQLQFHKVFLCRMNLSRTAKRQLQFHKFVLFHGRYVHSAEYYAANNAPNSCIQPIFAAFCQPLLNPENAEMLATGNTDAFSSQHFLDMKFKDMDNTFIEQLGYTRCELLDISWYNLIHPEHVADLAYKHRLLSEEKEGSVLALMKMQKKNGDWLWLHCVMSVRSSAGSTEGDSRRQRHTIHMAHQIVGENEAIALQANGWIYSMRHSYPTSFTNQDSPESLPADRPASPTSPFATAQPFGLTMLKPEPPCYPFPTHIPHPSLFAIDCSQIKVEIPMKGVPPPLCLITPEHSSPESSSSFPSHFTDVKRDLDLDANKNVLDGVSDLIRAVDRNALPELRDLDEFFKQEEYATSSLSSQESSPNVRHPFHFSLPNPTTIIAPTHLPLAEMMTPMGGALGRLPTLDGSCLPFGYPPFSSPFLTPQPPPINPTFYSRKRIGSWTGMM